MGIDEIDFWVGNRGNTTTGASKYKYIEWVESRILAFNISNALLFKLTA